MANKKKKSRKPKTRRATTAKADVDFPVAGTQDCFRAAQGTPFIAHGPMPPSGTVVAGAAVVVADSTPARTVFGRRLLADEFTEEVDGMGNPTGMLRDFPHHTVLGNATKVWAFVFTDFDNSGTVNVDLPADTPAAFIITTASVDGSTETVIPFEHHV